MRANEIIEENESEAGKYMLVRVGEECYAFTLDTLKYISYPLPIRKVPMSADYFMGLVEYRGKMSALIDLGRKFAFESRDGGPSQYFLYLETDKGFVAVAVNEIVAIVTCARSAIESDYPVDESVPKDFVVGSLRHEDKLFVVLELAKCLNQEDLCQIKSTAA